MKADVGAFIPRLKAGVSRDNLISVFGQEPSCMSMEIDVDFIEVIMSKKFILSNFVAEHDI